jgi:hypothetical protein
MHSDGRGNEHEIARRKGLRQNDSPAGREYPK